MDAKQIVLAYWQAMESNDFAAASQWLSEDFELVWPQSAERIRGRENFAALNSHYPAKGRWQFSIERIVSQGEQVVTDVSVTDGERQDRAITFHTVQGERITKQIEYWPENYPAPEWRAKWVDSIVSV